MNTRMLQEIEEGNDDKVDAEQEILCYGAPKSRVVDINSRLLPCDKLHYLHGSNLEPTQPS